MQEIDIIERIKTLCQARSWTFYRLAKESGITYSTLCTMLHKTNAPSIPTLIRICNGLGITLSEFFDEGNDQALLTSEERSHMRKWQTLTPENRATIQKYMDFLLAGQNNPTE